MGKTEKSASADFVRSPHHSSWDYFLKSGKPKPVIDIDKLNLDDVAKEVWKYLQEFNNPVFLFRRDGKLCRMESDDDGIPVANSLDKHRMNFLLMTLFNWTNMTLSQLCPPRDLASHLLANPNPPVPTLRRIVLAPIFTASGNLIFKPCEYADGIQYLPPKSFHLRTIPSCPSEADVRSAVDFLQHNLLADFQLASKAETANCFAALLTPFVREMIDGPTPLFWVDKSKGGSGGTLLCETITVPFLGSKPSKVTVPRDEAEWKRVILSTLMRSPNVFFIDNCNQRLSSETLASAITTNRHEDRIIGSSRNATPEVRCLWIINGNNTTFGWELIRRAVRIRIDPGATAPDDAAGKEFLHPNLMSWVIEHRAEIIHALLVLVTAWLANGRPGPMGVPKFHSFESWRTIVGGILHVAEITGFLANCEDVRRESDEESANIQNFVSMWKARRGLTPAYTSDLVGIGREFFELSVDPHSAAIQLGNRLMQHRDQVYDGLRIRRLSVPSKGKTQWQLEAVRTV